MPTPLRVLLLITAFVVMIGVARPAFAQAPFCDSRGATAIAPPPFTQIPDVRWEANDDLWFRHWCNQLQAVRTSEREPLHGDGLAEVNSRTGPDAGSPRLEASIPRRHGAQRVEQAFERSSPRHGFRGRVYRPPKTSCSLR